MLPSNPAVDLTTQLTWYPGSIRPYASLWHTLMRVATLNGHKAGELPGWPVGLRGTRHPYRSLTPLHNPGDAFATDVLAQALREAPAVFRWSHLGPLQPWLRPLVSPGFRVCLACLDEGYHSARYSLQLLQVCPIHSHPLLEHCHCGRPFHDKLTSADLSRRGCCPCGRLIFFTPKVCRVPTITAHQTRALDAVAHWLEALSRVVRSTQWRTLTALTSDVTTKRLVWALSNVLGMAYPDCLVRPPEPPGASWLAATHTQPHISPRQITPISGHASALVRHAYWADTPANHVYKSVSRYLRKHGVRHGDFWVQRFRSLNRHELQQLMQHEPEAVAAWTEWAWAQRVETEVLARRFPYRPPWTEPTHALHGRMLPHGICACPLTLNGAAISPQSPLHIWLQYQAAGFTLLQHWRAASCQAQAVAHDQSEDAVRLQEPVDWCAGQHSDGHWFFVSHAQTSGAAPVRWPRLALPNKADRLCALSRACDQSRQAVLSVCTGSCLTWHPHDGWLVSQAAQPNLGSCKRHKLLGLTGPKPTFWLFEAGDGFVARMCDARLQVFGSTPKDAIAVLRKWYPSFLRAQVVAVVPSLQADSGSRQQATT